MYNGYDAICSVHLDNVLFHMKISIIQCWEPLEYYLNTLPIHCHEAPAASVYQYNYSSASLTDNMLMHLSLTL